jgi:hypothetical protein
VGEAIERYLELLDEKRKLSNTAKHWKNNGYPNKYLLNNPRDVIRIEILYNKNKFGQHQVDVHEYIDKCILNTRKLLRLQCMSLVLIFLLVLCIMAIIAQPPKL